MNQVIFDAYGLVVTPWKLVGYLGVALFAGRWFVQMLASRVHGRPVLPALFWYMSVSGSVLLLLYFIFGKNDSVGVLSNLFPASVALYNLYLHHRHTAGRRA
ncbi:MAG: lipid-A-disaccharide synthase N-terminal domain-containing protein [Gammaproteobacteria bacterium]|nr:lipid-A-disaccharide synthase N-terminal domain-containing protein [Gammaproteobacteria bacterium]